MNTNINERKNIVVSLKSNYGGRKKTLEKRIQYLKGMIGFHLGMILICSAIVLTSFFLQPIWQKMGLLIILSISFILSLPQEIYELKLLSHLKNNI